MKRLLLAALLIPAAAHARKKEEIICVSVLHLWSGTLADSLAIETVPLPDSYRRMFGAGPCNSLHKPSLIDWHLAFGTEASVTAALAFLETEMTRGAPPPVAFLTGAEPAYRRAQPRLLHIAQLRATPGDHARALETTQGNPAVRTAQSYARSYEASVFLAQQYLRAAEFHRSAALLAKARPYLRVASEGVRLFFDDALISGSREPPAAAALDLFVGDVNQVRDMEARAAVLGAALSDAPADRAEATRLLDRGDTGLLRHAAEEAYDHGDDVCDVGDRTDLTDLQKACGEENDFEGRLIAWQRTRAELELLSPATQDGPVPAFYLAEKLLRHHLLEPGQGWSIRLGHYSDVLAALYIRRAERTERTSKPAERAEALTALREAERLTSPADNPARFRQIASRFAALWQALEGLPDPADRPSRNPALAREAAFLATTRAALPQIATGNPH